MNKIKLSALIIAVLLVSSAVIVHADVSNGDDDSGAASAVSGDNTNTAAVTNGNDDGGSNPPVNTGTNTTTGAVTNGDDDGGTGTGTPGTVTPGGGTGTPGAGGGPGSSSGSGSGSSSSSDVRVAIAPVLTIISPTSTCPLITSYLKFGGKNDQVQVAKLQAFLKNSEGISVEVTGTFDMATENAVKAFQKKYVDTILLPWGGTKASGFVYITTLKKINQIACQAPLTLSALELAIIQNFINNRVNANGEPLTLEDVINANTDFSSSTIDGALNGENLDVNGDTDSQAAAAGGTSFAARFWNFLKNLFR